MKKWLVSGLSIAVVLMLIGWFGPTTARSQDGMENEVIYLADSNSQDVGTYIYKVNLDDSTMQANLQLVTEIPLNQADAIACTEDGSRIYAIDKFTGYLGATGMMGYYDVPNDNWVPIDYVYYAGTDGVRVPQIGQAAFSPDGTLYAASDSTEAIYMIDTGTAEAVEIGTVQYNNSPVNIGGADIVFAADGTLYLWTNPDLSLYIVRLADAIGGIIPADLQGAGNGSRLTGMAIRANGFGDLLGSSSNGPGPHDYIYVISKTNGTIVNTYYNYLDGVQYDCWWGDMTTGPLQICTKTIGYWKNHSWEDETVTICGVEVDEEFGMEILWNARGNTYSMLFAQLIAAKLNTNNATGVNEINEAENYICETLQGESVWNESWVDHWADLIPKQNKDLKQMVSYLMEALDSFNNTHHCPEE